jgi:hypothetical protein
VSDFLVAYFRTQLEAVTSARKLLACGVRRERVTLQIPNGQLQRADGNGGEYKSSLHQAQQPAEHSALARSIMLSVTLEDAVPMNEVCSVLKEQGAYLIDVTEHNVTQEYPDM